MNNKEKAKVFIEVATELDSLGFFDVFVEYSQPENRILNELKVNKTSSPSYLSEKLNLSRVTITNSLNNLENDDLITREIDPSDRRKVICNITNKGLQEVTKLVEKATQFLADIFDRIGDEMSDNLVSTLQIIKKYLEK